MEKVYILGHQQQGGMWTWNSKAYDTEAKAIAFKDERYPGDKAVKVFTFYVQS